MPYLPFSMPSPHIVVFGVILIAVFNSVGEEILWRGVLADVLHARAVVRYGVQAVSFGVAHLHGIPGGVVGTVFAGIYSGIVYLLYRRYGFATALLAHFVTDLVLFIMMALTATYAFQVVG